MISGSCSVDVSSFFVTVDQEGRGGPSSYVAPIGECLLGGGSVEGAQGTAGSVGLISIVSHDNSSLSPFASKLTTFGGDVFRAFSAHNGNSADKAGSAASAGNCAATKAYPTETCGNATFNCSVIGGLWKTSLGRVGVAGGVNEQKKLTEAEAGLMDTEQLHLEKNEQQLQLHEVLEQQATSEQRISQLNQEKLHIQQYQTLGSQLLNNGTSLLKNGLLALAQGIAVAAAGKGMESAGRALCSNPYTASVGRVMIAAGQKLQQRGLNLKNVGTRQKQEGTQSISVGRQLQSFVRSQLSQISQQLRCTEQMLQKYRSWESVFSANLGVISRVLAQREGQGQSDVEMDGRSPYGHLWQTCGVNTTNFGHSVSAESRATLGSRTQKTKSCNQGAECAHRHKEGTGLAEGCSTVAARYSEN